MLVKTGVIGVTVNKQVVVVRVDKQGLRRKQQQWEDKFEKELKIRMFLRAASRACLVVGPHMCALSAETTSFSEKSVGMGACELSRPGRRHHSKTGRAGDGCPV